MAEKRGNCPFCGTTATTINLEHAFPDWTIRATRDIRGLRATFQVRNSKGGTVRDYMTEYPELLVHGPCKECNGGWMRQLEGMIASFMTPMITKAAGTVLDAHRRANLARWALKTAMVFELRENPRVDYFADADRRDVRNGTLPGRMDVQIWAAHYEGPRPWIHSPIPIEIATKSGGTVVGRLVTMIIGKLVLQIVAYPAGSEVDLIRSQGPWHRLARLYPVSDGGDLIWPPAEPLNDDDFDLLSRSFLTGRTRAIRPGLILRP